MLSSRRITHNAKYSRIGLGIGAGLLLMISGGCPRTPSVTPQSVNGNGNSLSSRVETPTPGRTTKAPAKAKHIVWEKTFEAALAKAKSSGKPVMVDVYAVWCGPCKMLDQEIYTAPSVIQESTKFINVKVDGEKRRDLMRRYKLTGFPTILLTDGDGKVIEMLPGVLPADEFLEFMRSGLSKHMVATVPT